MTDPQLALALIERLMLMFSGAVIAVPVALWLLKRLFYGGRR